MIKIIASRRRRSSGDGRVCSVPRGRSLTIGWSCAIYTHTPARESSTNFQQYYFVIHVCSTNWLGHGHGCKWHSSRITISIVIVSSSTMNIIVNSSSSSSGSSSSGSSCSSSNNNNNSSSSSSRIVQAAVGVPVLLPDANACWVALSGGTTCLTLLD